MRKLICLSVLLFALVGTAFAGEHGFLGVRFGHTVKIEGHEATAKEMKHAKKVKPAQDLDAQAALIMDVIPGSPAEKAGLQSKDLITKVNQTSVGSLAEFTEAMKGTKSGEQVTLQFLREGKAHTIKAVLGEKPMHPNMERLHWVSMLEENAVWAGFEMSPVNDQLSKFFGVEGGVLISKVVEGSPAETSGLQAGDVVTRIGSSEIRQPKDIRTALKDKNPGDVVDFEVKRKDLEQKFSVILAKRPENKSSKICFMKEGSCELSEGHLHEVLGGLDMNEISDMIQKQCKTLKACETDADCKDGKDCSDKKVIVIKKKSTAVEDTETKSGND